MCRYIGLKRHLRTTHNAYLIGPYYESIYCVRAKLLCQSQKPSRIFLSHRMEMIVNCGAGSISNSVSQFKMADCEQALVCHRLATLHDSMNSPVAPWLRRLTSCRPKDTRESNPAPVHMSRPTCKTNRPQLSLENQWQLAR